MYFLNPYAQQEKEADGIYRSSSAIKTVGYYVKHYCSKKRIMGQKAMNLVSGVATQGGLVMLYLPKILFTKNECKRSSMTWA